MSQGKNQGYYMGIYKQEPKQIFTNILLMK